MLKNEAKSALTTQNYYNKFFFYNYHVSSNWERFPDKSNSQILYSQECKKK